jgi:hypothetical protein
MIELLGAEQNLPFTVALAVMLGIALLEVVGTLMGLGFSNLLDTLLPDIDVDLDVDMDADVDVDADVDLHADVTHLPGVFTGVLSWLRIGQVPLLVLLVIFLTAFGLIGIIGQSVLAESIGFMIPASVAWVPALFCALPVVRFTGGWIARVMPKEETSAVSQEAFIGRIATIVLGTTKVGEPSEARLHDEHGRSHYVMVEPDIEGDSFTHGDPVLIVRREGARFRVIEPGSDALVDDIDGT